MLMGSVSNTFQYGVFGFYFCLERTWVLGLKDLNFKSGSFSYWLYDLLKFTQIVWALVY